jgi:toxin ParE1/3/4
VLDIDEMALYLAESSLTVARRFHESTKLSIQRLAANPDLGSVHGMHDSPLEDMRSWPIRGFPNHLICYRQIAGGVEILRILHGARDLDAAFDE